jgi:ubiquinone/menaquinone biosynthesis C-methylase UbiE
MSSAVGALHDTIVYDRRVSRLATLIAARIPARASVLDVGSGDGKLAARVKSLREDISVTGLDVLARRETAIPVDVFDGLSVPRPSKSVDVVTIIDVLHHADDAAKLLSECARVARRAVIVKDHLREGLLAGPTLRVMDWVGNARHGVALPYNYFSRAEWRSMFARIGLRETEWNEKLALYPVPADWIFGRHLHVLVTLMVSGA